MNNSPIRKVMITGANGNLGQRLITRLVKEAIPLCAVVRSDRARQSLLQLSPDVEVRVLDYANETDLAEVAAQCDVVVHLVGIIKEGSGASYTQAHENSTEALISAAGPGIKKIIYLSILGGDSEATNRCLASKGRAEKILLDSGKGIVIRIPMVLGEGDFASLALSKSASRRITFTFRAASLEQPIYAGDVIDAVYNVMTNINEGVFNLAGPESLSRRSLIKRAASSLKKKTSVVSLPLFLGKVLALLLERFFENPPVTSAMLGVLDHDDNIEPLAEAQALGLQLTPLNETLTKVLL